MKCPGCLAIKIAQQVMADSGYYEFESKGDLHRNVLLQTLENEGITFRDYDLSPTGIKARNRKTEQVLKRLFKAATCPRPPCILCVRKHISQAAALLQESLQGYPEHRDLAIGHLAEAEAEAQGISPEFASRLRQERLKVEKGNYIPDCVNLLNISYNIKDIYGVIMTIESRVAERFAASGLGLEGALKSILIGVERIAHALEETEGLNTGGLASELGTLGHQAADKKTFDSLMKIVKMINLNGKELGRRKASDDWWEISDLLNDLISKGQWK